MKTTSQKLQDAIIYLDQLLTGKDYKTALHTFKNQEAHITDFLEGGNEYYLSDGGYSRIVFNAFRGNVHLTSNSRPIVKDLWTIPQIQAKVEWLEGFRVGWEHGSDGL